MGQYESKIVIPYNEPTYNYPTTKNSLSILKPNFTVNDTSIENIINKNITDLTNIVDKYKKLDAPIIINNNNICSSWGNYNNAKYKNYDNQCLIIDGQNERSCLSNADLVSCSNYYSDGIVNNFNILDTNKILNNVNDKISIGT
jgi:hypothetical protein